MKQLPDSFLTQKKLTVEFPGECGTFRILVFEKSFLTCQFKGYVPIPAMNPLSTQFNGVLTFFRGCFRTLVVDVDT